MGGDHSINKADGRQPGYADPLADREAGHAVAERVDPSDNVVAWNDRDVGMGHIEMSVYSQKENQE
ncbi:Uncharacterised protein [Klebsiella pneumoniae]|nr:Uncharacterised protein [Klebsiella pneumoniae]